MTSSKTNTDLAEIEHEYSKCHSWIQGIAFGAAFKAEFGENCCKLDAVAIHLSRWGTAMGFTKSSSSAPSTEDCSEETIQRAKECLSAINTAFSQAFDDGSVFLETAGREQTNILDSQIQIGESSDGWNTLHKALQQIYQTRTPRNNTVPKPNVIRLYEQDTFVGLVQIVSAQIRRLNKVFPSLKAEQTTLSSDEVIAIKGSGPIVILWLKGIVKSNDEFLHEALEKETSNKRNFFDGTDLKGKSKMHVGHKIAPGAMGSEGPTTWTNTTGSEEAEGHVGNSYGY